jgi:hypothetical protein
MVEADPQSVLSSMQNSMWGGVYFDLHFIFLLMVFWIVDLMLQAAEEEERT